MKTRRAYADNEDSLEHLKARIASAAERAGSTTHDFILEAIAEKIALEELRAGFDEEADARYAKILTSQKAIPWTAMRQYLEDCVAGKHVPRPASRKMRS